MEVSPSAPESYQPYRGSFAELITSLTGRFVHFETGNIDSEIDRTLRIIGEFASVDRSYVFQFSRDGNHVTNTHEWCARGIAPAIDFVQDVPVDAFRWPLEEIRQGDAIYVANVADLPPDIGPVKQEFDRQGIQSVVCVPLQCSGKTLGFVGFDSVRRPKVWSDGDISVLKVVGEIIAGALEREAATTRLKRQIELETLVANISSRFINVPVESLDTAINRAIREIGRFTGVDRSYVFRLSSDGQHMANTHEWCAPGIEPQIDHLQDLPVGIFAYSMAMMRKGEVFYVPDVTRLPGEAGAERAEFEKEGIKTLINVPVMSRNGMTGFLGFDAVRTAKLWSEDDSRLLRLVGEILANAFDRKAANEELRNSLAEKDLLLREIHHRVKNNLQIVDGLLYLQMSAIRNQVEPEALNAFRQSQNRIRTMAQIHEQLYRSTDIGRLGFCDYLTRLIPGLKESYALGDDVTIDICGCHATLDIDRAIPCGLIVNELITNCLQHAFRNGTGGRIHVCLEQAGADAYVLSVSDDGTGFDCGSQWSQNRSLGLRLVRDLARQLGGTAECESRDTGTCIKVRFG